MDVLDLSILRILRHDGRRSISDIATELKVSRATVRSRIGRLEEEGEIVGYAVVLRADTQSTAVRGLTMIEVGGRGAAQVIDALASLPEVTTVHTTNGRWDLIVEITTETLTDLDAALRRLRLIPGITRSETNLLLATPRSSRPRT